jgi:hypothetical protein
MVEALKLAHVIGNTIDKNIDLSTKVIKTFIKR